jgi:hypothetical protein
MTAKEAGMFLELCADFKIISDSQGNEKTYISKDSVLTLLRMLENDHSNCDDSKDAGIFLYSRKLDIE